MLPVLLTATVWLTLVALLPAGPASTETAGPPLPRIVGSLEHALDRPLPPEGIRVVVVLHHGDLPDEASRRIPRVRERQGRVLASLPDQSFRVARRYRWLSGFAGWAQRSAIEAMARHPEVRALYADGILRPTLAQGVPLVGADGFQARGVTGAGVTVAVVDTGIDTDHPDLADDLVAEQCFCNDHPSPSTGCCPDGGPSQSGPGAAEDQDGHGTSVAGIVTSSGLRAPPGVAPDAGIVAIKVSNQTADIRFSDIDAALDWILLNHDAIGIDIVNLSLGDGGEHRNPSSQPCRGTTTAEAIQDLHAAGIAVFAASGNEGFDNGISFPACVAEAISVGGVYDSNLGLVEWCRDEGCTSVICTDDATQADDFVCHSNSDEILDLLAPDWRTRTSIPGSLAGPFGGTSAASPYAAAQAALLLQVDGTLRPEQVRTLLKGHGPLVTNPDNGLAFRRSDVGLALTELVGDCGNDVVDPGEDCDDGNLLGGDCCSPTCGYELGGSPCDDGDACTAGDACQSTGVCVSGAPLDCSDGNPCTDDSCNPTSGCLTTDNSDPCDDGDACTEGDACAAGSCQPGPPVACDDGNPCTDDSCDPLSGCLTTDNSDPCDDGDACTEADACAAGSCQPGLPLVCDDGLFCNGVEFCEAGAGCRAGSPPVLDDGVACTVDTCDELDGVVHTPLDALCDDGIVCDGDETCDPELGCLAGSPPMPRVAEGFDDLPVQTDDNGLFVPEAGETFFRITVASGEAVGTMRAPTGATGIAQDGENRFWTLDSTSSGGPILEANLPGDPRAGLPGAGAMAGYFASPRDLLTDPPTRICADLRHAAGTRPATVRFLLVDEDGNGVATTPAGPLDDAFETYEFEVGPDFAELLEGSASVDFSRIQLVGFEFSSESGPAEDTGFDVDDVRLVPEPERAALCLTVLGVLAWIAAQRARRARRSAPVECAGCGPEPREARREA